MGIRKVPSWGRLGRATTFCVFPDLVSTAGGECIHNKLRTMTVGVVERLGVVDVVIKWRGQEFKRCQR